MANWVEGIVLVTVVWVEELGEVSFGQRHETFGDLMCGILLEDAHHEGAAATGADDAKRDLIGRGRTIGGERSGSREEEGSTTGLHKVMICP